MESHNGLYSKKTIADLFGITERRIEQLAQKKIIPKAGKGVFDLGPTVQAYIRYLHGLLGGGISADTTELNQRLLQAQTQEREAKAALRQIELDQKKGELVTIGEVKRQWSARLVEFKAAMLEMPKRAAFRFTDADVRMHVEEELSGFVTEILARYSRGGICAVADGDNNAVEAAPVDNCKPVGRRKPNPKPKGKPSSGAVEDKPDALSS
jgi:phage terminase Nu1 subunit (DNA packaging protein)